MWVWEIHEQEASSEMGPYAHAHGYSSPLVTEDTALSTAVMSPVRLQRVNLDEQRAETVISASALEALQCTPGKDFILHSNDGVAVACHQSRLALVSTVLRNV